jgi:hypothetical protein
VHDRAPSKSVGYEYWRLISPLSGMRPPTTIVTTV